MLRRFSTALSSFVGGSVTELSLDDVWAASRPASVGAANISQLLNATYVTIISKEQTSLVRNPFYADYAAAYDGRLPFVDPAPLARWAYADSLPDSALAEALQNKTIFMQWFNSRILPAATAPAHGRCSSALLLYPGSTGPAPPPQQLPRTTPHPRPLATRPAASASWPDARTLSFRWARCQASAPSLTTRSSSPSPSTCSPRVAATACSSALRRT